MEAVWSLLIKNPDPTGDEGQTEIAENVIGQKNARGSAVCIHIAQRRAGGREG